MSQPVQIEPVPPPGHMQALRFLLAGSRCDFLVASQAEGLAQHLRGRDRRAALWWGRVGNCCVAAAMAIQNPGRVGMLLHTPADADGVDSQALAAVAQAAAQQGLQQGCPFVQAMIEDDRDADRAVIQAAGFSLLARLVHMRQSPPRGGQAEAPPLQWRSGEQFTPEELAQVIAATYEGSLDCPRLSGARRIEDVIAGHKAGGVYRPQSWWIVDVGGDAAGCVLMNDCTAGRSAEIAYLGVAPRFRGRGLGRALLHRAGADAQARRLESIELAVDEQNTYAKGVYESEGYRVTRRRWAYVMFAKHLGGTGAV
ncbi:MAG: GNAT family N-acetyltransferase [Phycisphaerae bacterium]|nr:GNAT family N-acetyltransferase [Phycisphaerae bacterium]